MTIRWVAWRGLVTLLFAVTAYSTAHAQPSAVGTVTPPVRADVALRGTVLSARNTADHLSCQSECTRTPGCTGYSFNRAAKATCTLLGGPLADVPVIGAVSCRMPCEPGPRASVLPPRPPVATLRAPAPATAMIPAAPTTPAAPGRPVGLQQVAPGGPVQQLSPKAATAVPLTASTQSASFGAGLPPATNLPPCPPGRVAQVGSCSNAAVAATPAPAPVNTTVTLVPVNDNTIGSSSLGPAAETTVHPIKYWFSSPGIGMGCNLMYGVLTGIQNISCARGLVKFNLASLAGKTIQSATLRLTTSAFGPGNYKDPWYVVASASPWSGSSVTWLNYGDLAYTASKTTHAAPTFVGQIFNVDQTITVRNWLSNSYVNNGFAMALNAETMHCRGCDSLNAFEFYSSEDTSGRGPKLIVTYQ